jgi:hypothetical protein
VGARRIRAEDMIGTAAFLGLMMIIGICIGVIAAVIKNQNLPPTHKPGKVINITDAKGRRRGRHESVSRTPRS